SPAGALFVWPCLALFAVVGQGVCATLCMMAVTHDLRPIQHYYDETWHDYRWLWLNPSNYAIHFGYWDDRTRKHADALNRLNAALAERIGIQHGARILDAGCGVGGSAIWLAETFAARVVGITPVASQVER